MAEYLQMPASEIDKTNWGIREKANQGLTFWNVPPGFQFRAMVGYDVKNQCIDPRCLIHHLPNSHVMDPKAEEGKVAPTGLIKLQNNHGVKVRSGSGETFEKPKGNKVTYLQNTKATRKLSTTKHMPSPQPNKLARLKIHYNRHRPTAVETGTRPTDHLPMRSQSKRARLGSQVLTARHILD